MRATRLSPSIDGVEIETIDHPNWQRQDKTETSLERADLYRFEGGRAFLIRIPVGSQGEMHSSGPHYGFCQIVRGKGVLELPGNQSLQFRGPELYLFDPGTMHAWRDVEEETTLAICHFNEAPA